MYYSNADSFRASQADCSSEHQSPLVQNSLVLLMKTIRLESVGSAKCFVGLQEVLMILRLVVRQVGAVDVGVGHLC